MRCKNCGSENDEKLYICQNCGSPLYDEEEPTEEKAGGTRIFATLDDPDNTKNPADAAAERAAAREKAEEEQKRKQQITIIVVLSVVLAAIIIGTVIAVIHANNKNNVVTSNTSVSASVSDTSAVSTTKKQESTTEETTTATTTTTTTTTTEKQTTEASSYKVSVDYNYGGTVKGSGNFKLGDTATVTATADTGYAFDGWYDGNTKVSSDAVYSFTVTENRSLKAIFKIVEAEPDESPGVDTETEEEVFD